MIFFCHSRGPQLTFLKKWSFFVTDRGPQLTFLKKRSFFVTDGGPQLTFLKSDHFSSLMGGINWPSCERDHFSSLIPADLLEKWSFFANERGPTDLLDGHIMFYPIINFLDGWGVRAGISKNVTDRHFSLLKRGYNWPLRWGRGRGRNNGKTSPFKCLDCSHCCHFSQCCHCRHCSNCRDHWRLKYTEVQSQQMAFTRILSLSNNPKILNIYLIFIGPESDHWLCLSLTP